MSITKFYCLYSPNPAGNTTVFLLNRSLAFAWGNTRRDDYPGTTINTDELRPHDLLNVVHKRLSPGCDYYTKYRDKIKRQKVIDCMYHYAKLG